MSIKYSLLENQLTSDPDDFRAIVQDAEVETETALIERMTSRGSTATRAETLAILEEYKLAIEEAIAEGKRINTDLVNIGTSVRGVFHGSDDSFDPARHTVSINVRPGLRLAQSRTRVALEKVRNGQVGPILDQLEDALSGEKDGLLTPGGAAILRGANLKIRTDLDGSGVFFMDAEGTETAVTTLIRNKPAELIFMLPALAAGEYQIEVRTAGHGSGTLHRGRLEADLTVAG